MQAQMLAPAAVLVLWSLIMLVWMAQVRFAAFKAANVDLKTTKPGGRGQDLEGVLPDAVNWKAHNYAHLMEQPTIFYPTVIILALVGAGAIDVVLAWAYVALRIIHSIWQSTRNVITIRLHLFRAATLCLIVLAVRAVIATLLADPAAVLS